MKRSNIRFFDLPTEILFLILKKLDNMDILYSLLDVVNERLDMIVQHEMFTQALNFVLTTPDDDILSIADPILNRFCISILPKISHNVKSLTLESDSMKRIFPAADYPNLTQLKIFNFNEEIFSLYFKDESPFHRMFQEQITDLILVHNQIDNENIDILGEKQYLKGVHGYILKFFKALKHFSLTGSPRLLSLRDSPMTTCSSSTLIKLCVDVNRFSDCLGLLDGRLKHLTMFTVTMCYAHYDSSIVYNMDDLPNLKCFSLTCICINDEYNTQVVPLLRRMSNLEELALDIDNRNRTTFVDGTKINDEILVHMPRLKKFNFYIQTKIKLTNLVQHLSRDDIQRTFTNAGYQQVGCILENIYGEGRCHVFSIPFVFDHLKYIGNAFPPMIFPHVIRLGVRDVVPFKQEYFIRIARFFPLLQELCVMNDKSQSRTLDKSDSDDNQLNSVVEFPYLVSLFLNGTHTDYVEQFLNETKTHLPRLTKLSVVDYKVLSIVTENFTRDTTRLNCVNVKRLIIDGKSTHSNDLRAYFPSL